MKAKRAKLVEREEEKNTLRIELAPYQYDFVYSPSRHPAMVGGWGVGKTLTGISRCRIYSRLIPNNQGVIFRKTAKSLFDSTLKDFEKYTKLKIDSQRNLTEANGSITMFRHIDEIGDINQQNLNLGWFMIEQGDELDSDKEFFMLWGRLRRELKPMPEFEKLGLPLRSGWVIANAGDHWMKPLWKGLDGKPGTLEGAHLVEATTFDNEKNLPVDFIQSLRRLETTKPEIYKQFVLNDWSIGADQYILITGQMLDNLKLVMPQNVQTRKLISCDPSQGGDACVMRAFENTKCVERLAIHENDTMKIVGQLMLFGNKHNCKTFAVDAIGIGAGICDRLEELGMKVIRIVSSETSSNPERWANIRAEIWGYVQEKIMKREVEYTEEPGTNLRKQLTAVRFDPKAINSKGFLKLEPKTDTKSRLGESPDDADSYVYGIYGLQFVDGANEVSQGEYGFQKKAKVFSGAGGW